MNKKVLALTMVALQMAIMVFVWNQGRELGRVEILVKDQEKYARIARMTFLYSCNDKVDSLSSIVPINPIQDLILRANCEKQGQILTDKISRRTVEIFSGDDFKVMDEVLAPMFPQFEVEVQEAQEMEEFIPSPSNPDLVI